MSKDAVSDADLKRVVQNGVQHDTEIRAGHYVIPLHPDNCDLSGNRAYTKNMLKVVGVPLQVREFTPDGMLLSNGFYYSHDWVVKA